jgi:hypothetical protein
MITVELSGASNDDDIRAWATEWFEKNRTWRRVWEGREQRIELIQFSDDYEGPPTFETLDSGNIALHFRGHRDAKNWKDWLGKFIPELCERYPALQLSRIT